MDSAEDCELIVKETCPSGVDVDIDGNCVEDPEAACRLQCGETADGQTAGKLVQGTGLCECSEVTDVDSICDADCRND